MAQASQWGDRHIDVRACAVCKALWPQANRTPIICAAMYALITRGDLILSAPREGFGANLKTRYRSPRPSTAPGARRS